MGIDPASARGKRNNIHKLSLSWDQLLDNETKNAWMKIVGIIWYRSRPHVRQQETSSMYLLY